LLRWSDGRMLRNTPQQDGRMDGTAEPTGTPTPKDYKSRPGALKWFFRKSRDGWKRKYQDLKVTIKGYQNRIADLTKSRQQWRLKAEQADERLAALEAEVADLRAQVAAQEDKKKRTREVGR
jgi:hypothetical protein